MPKNEEIRLLNFLFNTKNVGEAFLKENRPSIEERSFYNSIQYLVW